MDIDTSSRDEAEKISREISDKLLANPIMEDFSILIGRTRRLMMGKIKFGVIVFPGSNCDHDAHYASGQLAGQDSRLIWHKESSLGDVDVVIVPGGFSYGDYLRCGAIARFSPIMKDVVRFAGMAGGYRHMQRFSDSYGGRTSSRRAFTQ